MSMDGFVTFACAEVEGSGSVSAVKNCGRVGPLAWCRFNPRERGPGRMPDASSYTLKRLFPSTQLCLWHVIACSSCNYSMTTHFLALLTISICLGWCRLNPL